MTLRHDARREYFDGRLSKLEYAARLRELNRHLEEYCSFIASTELSAITLTAGGEVILESGLAPVRFSCALDDLGTAPMATLAIGRYEPLEMKTLLLLLSHAATFFDVGANVGWYSLHAAALFPSLEITAFEPVSASYDQLRRNIALSGVDVKAERLGMSDTSGSATIHVSPTLSAAASLTPSRSYEDHVGETIHLTTLDEYSSASSRPIDVLKADVEGAELLVLQGGTDTIRRDRPAVLAEMLRLHSKPFGYHPNEIINLMTTLGYRCFASSGSRWTPFSSMDEETVETNFLFLHEDQHASLMQSVLDLVDQGSV